MFNKCTTPICQTFILLPYLYKNNKKILSIMRGLLVKKVTYAFTACKDFATSLTASRPFAIISSALSGVAL